MVLAGAFLEMMMLGREMLWRSVAIGGALMALACGGSDSEESSTPTGESVGMGGATSPGAGTGTGVGAGAGTGGASVGTGGSTMNLDELPASASAGCGLEATPGYTNETLMVDDVWRAYAVNLPAGYSPERPVPLLLVFHGIGVTADETREYFGRHIEGVVGDNAIVVYPEARADQRRVWNVSGDGEYAFYDALLETLEQTYCIDTERRFATGFSLGAQMTNGLRCLRGDTLLGVAPVAGGEAFNSGLAATGMSLAACTGPVAAWIAHAPNDRLTSFELGVETRDAVTGTNGCSETTFDLTTNIGCLTHVAHEGCESYPVHWCEHEADHHYDALHARFMWDFFTNLASPSEN